MKYSFKTLAVVSASFLARSQEDVAGEVILENQDVLMTGARFSKVEKIEVYLLSKRARNL